MTAAPLHPETSTPPGERLKRFVRAQDVVGILTCVPTATERHRWAKYAARRMGVPATALDRDMNTRLGLPQAAVIEPKLRARVWPLDGSLLIGLGDDVTGWTGSMELPAATWEDALDDRARAVSAETAIDARDVAAAVTSAIFGATTAHASVAA